MVPRGLKAVSWRRAREDKRPVSIGEFRFNVLRGRAASGPSTSVALPDLAFPSAGLVDALPCGAMVLDQSRCIVAVNEKLGHLAGFGGDFFVIGEPFADFARRAALGGEPGLLALGDLIPADGDEANIAHCQIHFSSRAPLEARACRADNGQVLITLAALEADQPDLAFDTAHQILENLPGAVLRLNIRASGDIRVLYASPHSTESLGLSAGLLTDPDTDFRHLIAAQDRATFDQAIEASGPGGGHIDITFQLAMSERTPGCVASARCRGRPTTAANSTSG